MSARKIPITNRARETIAVAMVDGADYDMAMSLAPWHLGTGYARHTIYLGGGRAGIRTEVISLARVILGLTRKDSRKADHRDGDRLNNRRSNLRIVATLALNNQNVPARGGTSKYRGVTFAKDRGLWRAATRLNGTLHNHGQFASEEEAAAVALAWRTEHMPFAVEGR